MQLPFHRPRSRANARAACKPKPWRRRLYVERLEDRTLLPNTPVLVKDINPRHHDGLFIPQFTSFQGETFFSAEDGIHGIQLWKTDGTASGTVMVTDINPS